MLQKHLLLTFALFFCCFTLRTSAQVTLKPGGGINFTDWSKDPENGKVKAQLGWHIGTAFTIGKKVYIEPGIYLVGRSTKFTTQGDSVTADDFKADLHGLYIPVSLGAHFIGNETTAISLRGFGGASAFLLTASGDLNKSDFTNPDFAIFAGAGLDFWVFFVEMKYEWSLTNVQKDVDVIDVGKARTFYTSAGFKVKF